MQLDCLPPQRNPTKALLFEYVVLDFSRSLSRSLTSNYKVNMQKSLALGNGEQE